jgi:hypothetical protein
MNELLLTYLPGFFINEEIEVIDGALSLRSFSFVVGFTNLKTGQFNKFQ